MHNTDTIPWPHISREINACHNFNYALKSIYLHASCTSFF